MHYYPHHIGDFLRDTSSLSHRDSYIYLRLIWLYYESEKPLPDDAEVLAYKIGVRGEEALISLLLRTFFTYDPDLKSHRHQRIDAEISKYQRKASSARQANQMRWASDAGLKSDTKSDSRQIATKNQEPRTNNQEPIDIEPKGSLSGTAFPSCPQQEILALWKSKLPHLSQPRIWEGSRAAALRQRWAQAAKPSAFNLDGYSTREAGLEWWSSFFDYIAKDTKLSAGFESAGRVWKPDLEWVVNATNFSKIIDGKYDK